MKGDKFVEITSIMQVLGCLYNKPSIFENENYKFKIDDFYDEFHKIVYISIYNLWQLGAKEINVPSISDYLSQRPKAEAVFKTNKGEEFLLKIAEYSNINAFNYYYNRMKKMTLLRAYAKLGIDLSKVYDPDNIFDSKKKQEQEEWLDNSSLIDIYDKIHEDIDIIKEECIEEIEDNGVQISEGIDELIDSFAETPALGYPLFGDYINTVTRGARLGKFFLTSASTGTGKTRSMISHCCYIGCDSMYDINSKQWVSIGESQSALYIATEQDKSECQTMCLAFLAGVDEEHILRNSYFDGEIERVRHAAEVLKRSKIYFECLPDFTLQSIENTIKKNIRENNTNYIFMDYIHSSASLLLEVGGSKGVKNLREDNVLFLMSSKLKDLAVQYGVFILSSTQLNAAYQTSETPDQNLLRGSKAIADRIDVGMIMLETTKEDREKLAPFCNQNGLPLPNIKISVYKNRQGKWKGIYLWVNADRSICRFNPIFCTNYSYEIVEMENLKIKIKEEESAF